MKNLKTTATVVLLLLVVAGIVAMSVTLLGNLEDSLFGEETTKEEASTKNEETTKKEETTAADEETTEAGSDVTEPDHVVITFELYKAVYGDTVTFDKIDTVTEVYDIGDDIVLPNYSDNGYYPMSDTVLPSAATEDKTIMVNYYKADLISDSASNYFTPTEDIAFKYSVYEGYKINSPLPLDDINVLVVFNRNSEDGISSFILKLIHGDLALNYLIEADISLGDYCVIFLKEGKLLSFDNASSAYMTLKDCEFVKITY